MKRIRQTDSEHAILYEYELDSVQSLLEGQVWVSYNLRLDPRVFEIRKLQLRDTATKQISDYTPEEAMKPRFLSQLTIVPDTVTIHAVFKGKPIAFGVSYTEDAAHTVFLAIRKEAPADVDAFELLLKASDMPLNAK